ncbi:MAG: VPLPA-CTERM-specific exosortase XrtD [Proteobacteria bacterium]|nr:VPLPA-CTERM-specific exosortase XrtD [Pseudomonadota bacterium]
MQKLKEHKWLLVGLTLFTAGFLYLFWPHFVSLEKHWSNEDNSYCYLIPLVFAYLVWETRSKLYMQHCGSVLPGYLLMVLTGFVYLVGLLGSLETLVYVAMWLSIIAVSVLLFGPRSLRVLGFSFLVLVFAVPLPPFLIRMVTFQLKLISSGLAVRMLEWLSIPAYGEGNIIDMGVTRLQIIDACSGLRYLLPSILLALLIGHFLHTKTWKKLTLLVLSIPVTLVSNAFRIAMTGVLVTYVSVKFGEGFLHDFSGWVVYMVSIVLLGGLSLALRRIRPSDRSAKDKDQEVCTVPAALEKIWPHALVCAVLLAVFSLTGAYLFSKQFTPERETFSGFEMQVGEWKGNRLYLDQEVLDVLWADDYVTGNFKHAPTGTVLHMLVSYYQKQSTEHTAHAPTSCLVGSGWSLDAKEVLPPSPQTGRNFPVARMILNQAGTTVVSNFWFQQRGRHIVDEYKNKMWLVWDSFSMGRSDGALVRLELFLSKGQTPEEGQLLLDAFAGELEQRIKPYIPGILPSEQ